LGDGFTLTLCILANTRLQNVLHPLIILD
jgi:hypothetical protein